MAYFRPDKAAPNRVIFNWTHRSIGLIAYICSSDFYFLKINPSATKIL